ncbi:hypothetical protein Scel_31740 [Streptomyces cellostaticus]|nr:hypothetical protein Scel_31740 [Streptomyces cellostaticus]
MSTHKTGPLFQVPADRVPTPRRRPRRAPSAPRHPLRYVPTDPPVTTTVDTDDETYSAVRLTP